MTLQEILNTLDYIPHNHLSFTKENGQYVIFFEPKQEIDIDFAESKVNNVYKIIVKED